MADRPAQADARAPVRYLDAADGDAGQRIDNFLARHLRDVPRTRMYRLLRKGEVRVNGGRVRPDYRLAPGDRVRVPPVRAAGSAPVPGAPSVSLRRIATGSIIHEDADFIVVDKPAQVAVHGGSGIAFGIIEALRAERPDASELELVHRLDRDTSGCLLVAKRRSVLRALHALLRERNVDKRYLALVCGAWTLGRKVIDLPLLTNRRQGGERVVQVHERGQPARTGFVPLERFGRQATLLEVKLDTGRTHQIRVHAAYAGHAVAGDQKYGDRDCNAALAESGLARMFLHAASLAFEWPVHSGREFRIEAPLEPALMTVLEKLRARTARGSTRSGDG
jgi:23S rRNA pseudouridine955/2504/2580 synthase